MDFFSYVADGELLKNSIIALFCLVVSNIIMYFFLPAYLMNLQDTFVASLGLIAIYNICWYYTIYLNQAKAET